MCATHRHTHTHTHRHTHMHKEGVRKKKVFPGGSAVKKLAVMQEMCVPFLGQEGPLEEEIAICSNILA